MTEKELGISLANEVIEYFNSMPILTDDEEAMLQSAEWTKKQLTKKGSRK